MVEPTIYSYNVDLQQLNTSHSLAVLSVRPASRVLDLGAADGSVARALKARGCAVWAVELDEQAAEAARRVCDRVVVGDLETENVWQALEGETFDVILALDVLEHLRNPAPVLRRAASHLNANGVVVVSLPNVTHGALRLSLLNGHFEYTPLGLLDRTHLRFFDRSGAERLIADGGLVISERLRVKRGLDETEIPTAKEEIPPSLAEILARDPDSTTYQFIFVARRAADDPSIVDGAMLSERLQRENEALREQLLELEQYARNLEADRVARSGQASERDELREQLDRRMAERDELREELGRRMAEAHDMHRDLRHCKSDVAVKEAFIADLRAEILVTNGVVADLTAQRDNLDRVVADLTAQRDDLVSHQRELEASLSELATYANSAGFRLVEKIIAQLKRVPGAYGPARAIVRMAAGQRDGHL